MRFFKRKKKDPRFDKFLRLSRVGFDKPDDRDYLFSDLEEAKMTTLPPKVDLRPKMPPIVQQEYGCCATCATLAADQYVCKYKWKPSIPFTYYCVHDIEKEKHTIDDGATVRDTIKAIIKYGACNSEVWGDDKSWQVKPSKEAYADGLANNDKIKKYYRAKTMKEAKQALAAKHPVAIATMCYNSTWTEKTYETGIMQMPKKGEDWDGHALLLVGYDDSKKWFIVRNSWGTNIGDKGYFYMPYKLFSKICIDGSDGDCWVIVK